jgi:hypothetical protein
MYLSDLSSSIFYNKSFHSSHTIYWLGDSDNWTLINHIKSIQVFDVTILMQR